jgi:DNA-binding transcriptional regulator YiaG
MTPEQLTAFREAYNVSQAQLAAILRVGQPAVNRWENGERRVPGYAEAFIDCLVNVPAMRKYVGVKGGPKP